MTRKIRSYSELRELKTFVERADYLFLGDNNVGSSTFGFDRYLNQKFYKSTLWKRIRDAVLLRDGICDLGVPGFEILEEIIVHHINPVNANDLRLRTDDLLSLENLITVSSSTHRIIHFGKKLGKDQFCRERRKGDTTLW